MRTIYAGTPCTRCHRMMRSTRQRAGDFPGTVVTGVGGLCKPCAKATGARLSREERDAVQDAHREHVVAEVRFLVGTDSADGLARRLGYTNGLNLVRVLDRWDETRLARRVERTIPRVQVETGPAHWSLSRQWDLLEAEAA